MLELRKVREVLKHHLILCWEQKTIVLLSRKEHCKSSCSHVLKQNVLYNFKNVCCYIKVFQYFNMLCYWVTYCHHPVLCNMLHAVGLADIFLNPLPAGLLCVGSTRGKLEGRQRAEGMTFLFVLPISISRQQRTTMFSL